MIEAKSAIQTERRSFESIAALKDHVFIVFLDDKKMISRVNAVKLEADEGFKNVTYFTRTKQFLKSLVDEVPDVIIIDQEMPGMTGLELVEFLK